MSDVQIMSPQPLTGAKMTVTPITPSKSGVSALSTPPSSPPPKITTPGFHKSGSQSPPSPPRSAVRVRALHPSSDLDDSSPRALEKNVRRRSLAMAHMNSINTNAANQMRHQRSASTSLDPSVAYSSGASYSSAAKTDILPMLSPSAQLAQESPDKPYFPGQEKSLSGIAEQAFVLGVTFTLGLSSTFAVMVFTSSPLWRLPFFLTALSVFHFLEFWTTARYNTAKARASSFLLTSNGRMYFIAHASAFIETLVVGLLFPHRQWAPLHSAPLFVMVGLALVVAGQAVRSAAMVQCGVNFDHVVQQRRAPSHELVTTGIYATLRHPSYFGYFWWALGTQLVMGNVVCFLAFAIVLWRFFNGRIKHEEKLLIEFFGDEYIQYRNAVGTKIPLIR